MSVYCVVKGCPNKGSIKLILDPLIPVNFHRYPSKVDSPQLYEKWQQQMKSPTFIPPREGHVCSIHFTTDDFEWPESLQSIQLKARFFPGEYLPPDPSLKTTAFPSIHLTGPPPGTVPADESMCESKRLKELKKKGRSLNNKVPNKKPSLIAASYKHLKNQKKEKKFADKGIQCELGIETYRSQPGVTVKCENLESSPEQLNTNAAHSDSDSSRPSSTSSDDSFRVTSSEHDSESEFSSINDYEEDEILATSLMGINEETRARKNDWCKCGTCVPMNVEYESNCCHDCEAMLKVRETVTCVTSHGSFESVVLNVHTLNATRHYMVLNNDSLDAKNELKTKTNRLWRHIAYKQFIHWVNSLVSFGDNQIKIIPACVISKVRETFPEASGIYSEFKPAKRGYEPDYFD